MRPEDEIGEPEKKPAQEAVGGSVPARPLAAPAETEEDGAEEEPRTGAEKKEKRFWPLALVLVLFVLAGGGYYALTGMRQTAHQLGGGSDYDKLSANSEVYDGAAGNYRQLDVFAGGDAAGAAAGASSASAGVEAGRINPALARTKEELLADARGKGASSASVVVGSEEEPDPAKPQRAAAQGVPEGDSMAGKLGARGFSRGKQAPAGSKSAAPGSAVAFTGSGSAVGRGSVQSETAKGTPKQAGKGSVMDTLKGAFRATFYGARLASNDAARNWVSRAFDASEEASTAIEYDEKMRASLDRVNPGSIPNFLRDQDVTAAEAKRLADSDVSKPKLDKQGTFDALREDEDYQKKKLAKDFGGSMINGLFAGVSGTGSSGDDDDRSAFSDPEDEETFGSLGLGEYMDSEGYGAECGCTASAPCCCLPQDYFSSVGSDTGNCPMYGPFLPDDPCAAAFYGGSDEGAGVVSQ